ncbi:uncharacterized protein LOC126891254 [Diabrotica virgifera virgifera]|uniref:BED-type domain-containing protein n=1 Tax=Diabrotica virgifera virgifera TaxID=50390 RepID=A0ABM5L1S6_DIAVI|nr:uncharacterized protein LOC126891254 [Diabrotica virgifera virgifera]
MSTKRSAVWDYFTQNSRGTSKVKCNLCFSQLACKNGSTPNMTRHLKLKHPTINIKDRRKTFNIEEQEVELDADDINTPGTSTQRLNVIDKTNTPGTSTQGLNVIDDLNTPGTSTQRLNFDEINVPGSSTSDLTSTSELTTTRNVSKTKQLAISGFIKKPIGLSRRHALDRQLLKFIVTDYQPFNIVESRNFKKFVRMLNLNYELPSRKVQSSLPTIADTVDKVKSVVEFFKRSSSATEKLKLSQKRMGCKVLKLKQDCPTRWNSTYEMLSRFHQNKESLHDSVSNLVDKLYEEVTSRFKRKYRNIDLIWEAKFLDPRFKQHGFHDDDSFKRIKEIIINKCCQIKEGDKVTKPTDDSLAIPTSSTSSKRSRFGDMWSEFDSTVDTILKKSANSRAAAIIEVDKYLHMPLISRKDDPLLWWKGNKSLFPSLFELMQRRLCIPATSVPSERIFSKTGQIITERRNRLSVEKSTKIIFLNSYFNNYDCN